MRALVDFGAVAARVQSLRWIRALGGDDLAADDLDHVAELVATAARR